MIPYDDIIETADRRWTHRLLERLTSPGLGDEELEKVVGALSMVADPRSFAPLETTLTDPGRPPRVREAASRILRDLSFITVDPPAAQLRRWWEEGDAVLRRHALLCMDGAVCPDIVVRVASDPTHSLHAEAVDG